MNRLKWLLLAVVLLLVGGVAWFFSCPSNVQLAFVRYEEINGQPVAILRLENRGSEPIFCCGKPGTPDYHFRAKYADGEMEGPGVPASSGIPGDVRIDPGESIEFSAKLRLSVHQRDVVAPFQAAIKYTTPSLLRRHRLLHSVAFPYRFRPSIERTVWTDRVSE